MSTLIEDIAKIEMVDLRNQYLNIKPAIDQALFQCIEQGAFIKGPQVATFENHLGDFLQVPYVVSCANGTDALQIAMMTLDLKPGDEVIVPAFTYAATAEVIGLLGLTPVMVDVDPLTFNLSIEAVSEAISPKTRLIVPVHLFGQCADMGSILSLARPREIMIVEDNAQAIGAACLLQDGRSVSAGGIGDMGTTSFFPSKNLGCFGDGGAVYTCDDNYAQRARMIANHGQRQKYQHDVIGINSRLDTIQAAILLEKLKNLPKYLQARQRAAAYYDAALADIEDIQTPYCAPYSTHVFHQYTIKVAENRRNDLKKYLQERQVPSMIYYPLPLYEQPAYRGLGRVHGSMSVTAQLCQQVLSLPMHTELSDSQLDYICTTIRDFFSR